jgi:2-polyprenyl-6-methoxyphenol hydroxylase-like FAD-dependent oxidoreductase
MYQSFRVTGIVSQAMRNHPLNLFECLGTTGSPNVFLVGDSAHRFPPSGGFGMNTGDINYFLLFLMKIAFF